MTEAPEVWFNPALYAWIPGTTVGMLGGLEGALAGLLAQRGKGKALVLGLHFGTILLCAVLLLAGIIAKVEGQPYGIWYGLGFPGLLGMLLYCALTPVILRPYRQAALGKSQEKGR